MAPRIEGTQRHPIGTYAAKRTSTKELPTMLLEAIPSPILKVGAKFSDPTQYWVVDASGKRLYLLEKRVSSLKRTNKVVFVPPQAPEEQPLDFTLFNGAFSFVPEPTFEELFDKKLGSEITNILEANLNVCSDVDFDFDFSGMEIPDLEEIFPSGFTLEELEEIMEAPLQC